MMKCNSKIKMSILYISIFIVLVTVLFIFYNFFCLRILKHDYARFFEYTMFQVASGSMADSINVDDIVIVRINADYDVGDIITYKQDNDFITHRIIKKENDYIVTKGDANNAADAPVSNDQVVGKVVRTIKNISIWKKVFATPKVIILTLITISLFAFYFTRGNKDEKNN